MAVEKRPEMIMGQSDVPPLKSSLGRVVILYISI